MSARSMKIWDETYKKGMKLKGRAEAETGESVSLAAVLDFAVDNLLHHVEGRHKDEQVFIGRPRRGGESQP